MKGLLLAGLNIYTDDGEPDQNEHILVQIDAVDGSLDYFSRIIVGEIIDDEINVTYPPFTGEQVRVLERHVNEQDSLGIEITLA